MIKKNCTLIIIAILFFWLWHRQGHGFTMSGLKKLNPLSDGFSLPYILNPEPLPQTPAQPISQPNTWETQTTAAPPSAGPAGESRPPAPSPGLPGFSHKFKNQTPFLNI